MIWIMIPSFLLHPNSTYGQESNVVNHHKIKENETAYRISLNNQVPLDSLRIWNNLDSNTTIEIGQILIISQPNLSAILHDTLVTYTPLFSELTTNNPKLSLKKKLSNLFKQSNHVLKVFVFINLSFILSLIFLFGL